MSTKTRVAALLTNHARPMVMRKETEERLDQIASVTWAEGPEQDWDMDDLLGDAEVALTGWYTPPLTLDLLSRHPNLRLIAHTAGSVRGLLPLEVIGDRLRVTHATEFFAPSVSEFTILQMLSVLRHLPLMDRRLKEGASWSEFEGKHPPGLLGSRTVGVIGASRSGQAVIKLLRAFGSRVIVVDPTISASKVRDLGAEPAELHEMLPQADIVTLHAPLLPETEGLLGSKEFSMIRDGGIVINSARGGLVDNDAFFREVSSGRINAALDVFAEEPLPVNDSWRKLSNAIISPHRAGLTIEAHLQNGDAMVDEIARWAEGEALRHELPAERAAVTA